MLRAVYAFFRLHIIAYLQYINSPIFNIFICYNKTRKFSFVFSKELIDKKLTNEQFVRMLYLGLFDREPDTIGYNEWMKQLNNGSSRTKVFEGFAGSQEFADLVKSFEL